MAAAEAFMTPKASVPGRSCDCNSAALVPHIDNSSCPRVRCLAIMLAIIIAGAASSDRTLACTDVSADITSAVTWGPTGSPPDTCYHVVDTLTVQPTGALTIQPGTH